MTATATGQIVSYDEDSGNGYIRPDSGGSDIQFERDDVADLGPGERIKVGQRVRYNVEGGLAGIEATHILRIAD